MPDWRVLTSGLRPFNLSAFDASVEPACRNQADSRAVGCDEIQKLLLTRHDDCHGRECLVVEHSLLQGYARAGLRLSDENLNRVWFPAKLAPIAQVPMKNSRRLGEVQACQWIFEVNDQCYRVLGDHFGTQCDRVVRIGSYRRKRQVGMTCSYGLRCRKSIAHRLDINRDVRLRGVIGRCQVVRQRQRAAVGGQAQPNRDGRFRRCAAGSQEQRASYQSGNSYASDQSARKGFSQFMWSCAVGDAPLAAASGLLGC